MKQWGKILKTDNDCVWSPLGLMTSLSSLKPASGVSLAAFSSAAALPSSAAQPRKIYVPFNFCLLSNSHCFCPHAGSQTGHSAAVSMLASVMLAATFFISSILTQKWNFTLSWKKESSRWNKTVSCWLENQNNELKNTPKEMQSQVMLIGFINPFHFQEVMLSISININYCGFKVTSPLRTHKTLVTEPSRHNGEVYSC